MTWNFLLPCLIAGGYLASTNINIDVGGECGGSDKEGALQIEKYTVQIGVKGWQLSCNPFRQLQSAPSTKHGS